MARTLFYVAVDCYPRPGSEAFRRYAAATVGCWLREDICTAIEHSDAVVVERLAAAGWSVVRTLSREEVSEETYTEDSVNLEFFRQAVLDGFVAHLHVVARLSIGSEELDDEDVTDILANLPSKARIEEAFSFYSDAHGQWANGVLEENEFVPFWLSREAAEEWAPQWPGYRLRCLPRDELVDFLDRVDGEKMWVGLGIAESLITLCHPLWIRDLLPVPR